MDTCSEHKEKQLRDYLLNRLSPEEMEAFQFHLFHCTSCQNNLKRMRQLAQGEEQQTIPLPDRTERDSAKPLLLFSTWMRVAAVAGLLCVLVGGGYYYFSSPVEEEWQIEMKEMQVLHSGDSVRVEADSTAVELKKEETGDEE